MVLPPEYLHFFVMSISLVFIVLATLVLPESPHWLVRLPKCSLKRRTTYNLTAQ